MTISSSVTRFSYTGDGVTTVFAIPGYFFDKQDIKVFTRTGNVETALVLDTDYTVSGAGDIAGGEATLLVAPASGANVVINIDPPLTQEVDYNEGDDFPAETHERALDKLTRIAQRLSARLDRALTYSETAAGLLTASEVLERVDDAEDARDKAQEWAENAEDVPVSGTGGLGRSALHYSEKSKDWSELSQAWAEGTEPDGPGTKSAAEHAADAEASAASANPASYVRRDGTQGMLANLPMGGFKITGLVNGTANTDAATVGQLPEGRMIGEIFYLADNLAGVAAPSNDGAAKYIKLTAGLSGGGGYNEGLLASESVSGSAPLVSATAQISSGPMTGATVHLINTERRFLRAGSAGTLQNGQIEAHDHAIWTFNVGGSGSSARFVGGSSDSGSFGGGDDALGVRRTGGDETRPRNIGVTAYMRIA